MKVMDLLNVYDEELFKNLIIEFRENNFFIQTIYSSSKYDFINYTKYYDCEINRWFIYNINNEIKLVIDIQERR